MGVSKRKFHAALAKRHAEGLAFILPETIVMSGGNAWNDTSVTTNPVKLSGKLAV